MYRVTSGSGRGSIRSRRQATTDLYQELRDRTAAGNRLDVAPYGPVDAGSPAVRRGDSAIPKTVSDESLLLCAVRLLEVVDGLGGLALDVVHTSGLKGCLVSMGTSVGDAGGFQCLINEPERAQTRDRGGIHF
jgi:hypothetical protein